MTQFFAFLFLFLMAIPALIAISVGSRSVLGFIWNGVWFYIIGQTAQTAFDSPSGQYVGLVLAICFIWRSLVFRRRSPFVFRGTTFSTGFPSGTFKVGTFSNGSGRTDFGQGFPPGRGFPQGARRPRSAMPDTDESPAGSENLREVIEAEIVKTPIAELNDARVIPPSPDSEKN